MTSLDGKIWRSLSIVYLVIALWRVYGLSVAGAVWRSFAVVFMHGFLLMVVLLAVGLAGANYVLPIGGG